ncbi:MAG TPA: Crp/Fnr family transcriptional regulator [Bacteroidia bacterium]|jgi:CRP-like cAMP-binding protein
MPFTIEKYYIKATSILEGLPAADSAFLKKNIIRIEKPKGKVLFREGSYTKGVYVIQKGKVKIYQTNEMGKEQIIYVYRKGEMLGCMSLINSEPSPVSAALLENCVFSFIPAQVFIQLLERSFSFARKILANFSHEYSVMVNKISLFAQRAVRERVAIALLILHEKYRKENKRKGPVEIDLSRDDLANYTGTTVETLVRMLRSFKDEKIISTKGRKITILDHGQLARIYEMN